MSDPVLVLLAGPNGAGKSTLFERVIEPATHLRFVNADGIAAERWPGAAAEHGYEAAALAAQERDRLIAGRVSFATETVFSHASKLELIEAAQRSGYLVNLQIVLIPEDLAVARVAERVVHGGHDVPEGKIRTRCRRLWDHVQQAVGLADEAHVYDNARAASPFRLVARFRNGALLGQAGWPEWTPGALRAAGGAAVGGRTLDRRRPSPTSASPVDGGAGPGQGRRAT